MVRRFLIYYIIFPLRRENYCFFKAKGAGFPTPLAQRLFILEISCGVLFRYVEKRDGICGCSVQPDLKMQVRLLRNLRKRRIADIADGVPRFDLYSLLQPLGNLCREVFINGLAALRMRYLDGLPHHRVSHDKRNRAVRGGNDSRSGSRLDVNAAVDTVILHSQRPYGNIL